MKKQKRDFLMPLQKKKKKKKKERETETQRDRDRDTERERERERETETERETERERERDEPFGPRTTFKRTDFRRKMFLRLGSVDLFLFLVRKKEAQNAKTPFFFFFFFFFFLSSCCFGHKPFGLGRGCLRHDLKGCWEVVEACHASGEAVSLRSLPERQ